MQFCTARENISPVKKAQEKFPPCARRGKMLKRMQLQNDVQALPACRTNSVLSRIGEHRAQVLTA